VTDLSELIERIEAGENSNKLDVLIELAMFKPDWAWKSARPNDAGTKVIFTTNGGTENTFRAWDWCDHRDATLAALKAHQTKG